MLSQSMIDKLNAQITLEHYSANLYLQMSAWCDHKGYTGCAAFLKQHAAEEMMHMHKLFAYVSETGGLAVLGAIDAPPTQYEDLGAVFEMTLAHEREITQAINTLAAAALAEQDFSTFNFLQWYVAEQHEEEALFMGIVDKINIIGLDGKGIYYLDKEIRKLMAAPTAAAAPAE